MKILFCYESIGIHQTPIPLSKALSKIGNQVINCGPGKNQDIKTRETENIDNILKRTKGIDLIFIEESSFIPKNIETCKIPKAIHFVDSHLHFDVYHKDLAKIFDFVFFAQMKYVKKLKRAGHKNVFYLPWACDPQIHKNLNLKRKYDFGFVGTFNTLHNPKRSLIFAILKRMFKGNVGKKVYGKDMAKIYNVSKIAVNPSIGSDLNMRTFEIMACGAMLISDLQNNMLNLFQNKKHLVIYKNIFEVPKLIKYYLKNEKERLKIAAGGQKEVLKKHTYDLRAKKLIEDIKSFLKNSYDKKTNKLDYYRLGRTYFFLYKRGEAIPYLKKFISSQKRISVNKIESIIFLLIANYFTPLLFRISIIFLRRYYKIKS